MNCINLRKRTKKKQFYIYCKVKKKEISYGECRLCNKKEYKQYNPIKKRTSKQAKVERERFSIIYSDLTKCCKCGSKIGIQKNEVFEGAYRQISMRLGMIAPFCESCHDRFHNDIMFNLYYKVMFQKEYMKTHSLEDFISIFKQDYIYKYSKLKK